MEIDGGVFEFPEWGVVSYKKKETRRKEAVGGTVKYPLVLQRPIYSDESLPSYLSCLRLMNKYNEKKVIHTFCKLYMIHHDSLTLPRHPDTYRILSELTGRTPENIYQATFHYYSQQFTPDEYDLETMTLGVGNGKKLLSLGKQRYIYVLNYGKVKGNSYDTINDSKQL